VIYRRSTLPDYRLIVPTKGELFRQIHHGFSWLWSYVDLRGFSPKSSIDNRIMLSDLHCENSFRLFANASFETLFKVKMCGMMSKLFRLRHTHYNVPFPWVPRQSATLRGLQPTFHEKTVLISEGDSDSSYSVRSKNVEIKLSVLNVRPYRHSQIICYHCYNHI
jgi:hypothetical protein